VDLSSRLQPSDFNLSNDESRPVLFALSHAFVENMSAFFASAQAASALAARSDKEAHETQVLQLVEDCVRFARNLKALLSWIYPRKVLPIEEAVLRAQALKELGDDWVESVSKAMQKFPEGAPPRMRQLHIDVFEFMLQSKKNSLGLAVRKFCPCGGTHTLKCRQRLKTGVRSLKKMLRHYAPDLVSRYDSLHPNRDREDS
jgi:hypothetical protein